jgi:hypothetical protein
VRTTWKRGEAVESMVGKRRSIETSRQGQTIRREDGGEREQASYAWETAHEGGVSQAVDGYGRRLGIRYSRR